MIKSKNVFVKRLIALSLLIILLVNNTISFALQQNVHNGVAQAGKEANQLLNDGDPRLLEKITFSKEVYLPVFIEEGDWYQNYPAEFALYRNNTVVEESKKVLESWNMRLDRGSGSAYMNVEYTDLPKYDENGNEYKYDIRPVRFGAVDIKIKKTWKDVPESEIPESVEVELYKFSTDSERVDIGRGRFRWKYYTEDVYDRGLYWGYGKINPDYSKFEKVRTVTLTKENNWELVIDDIDTINYDGLFDWYTIKEVPVEGFESELHSRFEYENQEDDEELSILPVIHTSYFNYEIINTKDPNYTPNLPEFHENYSIPIEGGEEVRNNLPKTVPVYVMTKDNKTGNYKETRREAVLSEDKTKYLIPFMKEDINNPIINIRNEWKFNIGYYFEPITRPHTIDDQDNIIETRELQKYKFVSPKIRHIIQKVWKDGETIEKPNSIDVKVKRKVEGSSEEYEDVKTVTLRKENNWQIVIEGEQLDGRGRPYAYNFEEITKVDGFNPSYYFVNHLTLPDEDPYGVNNDNRLEEVVITITNTYQSPLKDVEDNITVIGGGEQKPTVKVVLKQDGKVVEGTEKIVNLNDINNVSYPEVEVTNKDGKPYEYKVEIVEITNNPNESTGDYEIDNETLTLTFVPKKEDITGSVQIIGARTLWEDVTVALYRQDHRNGTFLMVSGTEKVVSVNELEKANNNTVIVTYPQIEVVDMDNNEETYEIRALTNIDSFTKTQTGNDTVYTYTAETKDVPYEAIIIGGNTTPNITVRIINEKTGEEVRKIDLTGQTSGTAKDLPLRDPITGEEIVYKVVYDDIPNYERVNDNTFKYVSPKTKVDANIIWENGENIPNKDIEVELLQDGKVIKTVTVKGGTTNYPFQEVDLTDENGREYKYSINVPTNIPNHTKEYPNDTTVKLVYKSPIIEHDVQIIKEGGKAVDVVIELIKNGQKTGTTKTGTSGSSITFDGLEDTSTSGNKNNYSVVVNELPEGYTPIVNDNKTITIKYTSPKVSLDIQKNWVDGEFVRPDSITAKIQRRLKGTNNSFVDVKTITITKENDWKITENNLDKTDNDANEYEYKVVEVSEVENFESSVNELTITNTYMTPKGDKDIEVNFVGKPREVTVKLKDENGNEVSVPVKTTGGTVTFPELDLTNRDGTPKKYTGEIVDDLGERYEVHVDSNGNITLTYVPRKQDYDFTITIPEKLKEDITSIEVELIIDGKPSGEIITLDPKDFVDGQIPDTLIKEIIYKDRDMEDIYGNEIKYTIDVITNISGHENTYDDKGNVRVVKVIEEKEMKANVNFDGGSLRPNVIVELIKDGVVIDTIKTSTSGEISFGNYPLTDENGIEYKYEFNIKNVDELKKKNYETKINGNSITLSFVSPKIDFDFSAIVQGTTKDNVPPVKVQLIRDGLPTGEVITLDNNLEYVFKGLDEYSKDGKKYNYSVQVVGNVPNFEVINVSPNKVILKFSPATNSNEKLVPILPYAGAEKNIGIGAILITMIVAGLNNFKTTKRAISASRVVNRGIRK